MCLKISIQIRLQRENITALLLPKTGLIRSHIENIMLREIQKTFDARILKALGKGKKKHTEIKNRIGGNKTGLLDRQLKNTARYGNNPKDRADQPKR